MKKDSIEKKKAEALAKARDVHQKAHEAANKRMQGAAQKVDAAVHERRRTRQTVTENRLKLLVITVPRNKSEFYVDLIQSFDVNMQMTVLGEGTASTGMLATLGLTESSKAVIFAVIQEIKLPEALTALEEKFNTIKGGKGIAYTVPLTSVIGTLIFGFLSDNKRAVKENR